MKRDLLDLDLCSACVVGHSEWELRPSVIKSEFFRDYSMKRILIDPERAWADISYTPAIGLKSALRIATAVGMAFAERWPQEWAEAVARSKYGLAAESGLAVWPVSSLQAFIEVWEPDLAAIVESIQAKSDGQATAAAI